MRWPRKSRVPLWRDPNVRRQSVRHARGHVVRELEKVVGVDVPSRPGRRETRRDDRRHSSMMSSWRTSSLCGCRGCRVGQATHPGPSVLRRNLLKREGLCPSRSRSRPTQVDNDCKPLVHSGGLAMSSDSVGEASHPGPGEGGMASTQIDHDDDPPVRSGRFAPPMPSMVGGPQFCRWSWPRLMHHEGRVADVAVSTRAPTGTKRLRSMSSVPLRQRTGIEVQRWRRNTCSLLT